MAIRAGAKGQPVLSLPPDHVSKGIVFAIVKKPCERFRLSRLDNPPPGSRTPLEQTDNRELSSLFSHDLCGKVCNGRLQRIIVVLKTGGVQERM